MVPIRAILFDADGVIQHSTGDDIPVQLQRIFGFVPENLETFMREVFNAEQPALTGEADFAKMLEPVVTKWGATGTAPELARAWWCSINVDEALVGLVAKLRRQGILCALATNQQRYRAEYMNEHLSYDAFFDRAFYSYELGFKKPDSRYFKGIIENLRFAPTEILFVDDAETNVTAAQNAGLQAAQFVHPRNADAVPMMRKLLEGFLIFLSDMEY